jgi:hypothetical protein
MAYFLLPLQMSPSTFSALTSSAPGVYAIEPREVVDVKVLKQQMFAEQSPSRHMRKGQQKNKHTRIVI